MNQHSVPKVKKKVDNKDYGKLVKELCQMHYNSRTHDTLSSAKVTAGERSASEIVGLVSQPVSQPTNQSIKLDSRQQQTVDW